MTRIACLAAAAASLVLSAAAAAQTVTQGEERINMPAHTRLEYGAYRYEPIVTQRADSPAGVFNSGMIFLADQINRNVTGESRGRPTVITSIAPLGSLGESSPFGRLVSEHLMHEMQVRGWAIADVRMTRDLIINESGEFVLSRDIRKIRESMPLANVVTGTYTPTSDGVLVTVRVLDVSTGQLVSSAQTRFIRNSFVASLIDKPPVLPVVTFSR
ncbi:MAG: hypothetical protein RLZZ584_336 [Pseudomonadota bacterium]|jgi:TolB-like protein